MQVGKTASDVPFEAVAIPIHDPPLDEIATCIDIWKCWRGEDNVARWRSSDMMLDLPSNLIPRVVITEWNEVERDHRFRYWGSDLTSAHGYDLSNRYLGELKPESFRQSVRKMTEEVLVNEVPRIFLAEAVNVRQRRFSEYVLRIPLSSDGETASMVLAIIWMDIRQSAEWFKQVNADADT